MKILDLDLLAYGPFTDTKLDFAASDCGLHIVYGPNEAGKSSTLRAIHGLLFGIKANTSDNFLHDNRKLRIGGRLLNSSGGEIHFHRRKGNKDTLLNPLNEKGGAFPDSALEPFIRGVDRSAFANVYGIGNAQLEHGGQEMAELRGLVGESLFAATVGGPGLAKLLRSLDEEATSVFASRKSSSSIRKLATRRKEIEKDRHALRLTMSNWKKLRSDLEKARERRDSVVNREKDLNKQLQRLKRIRNGLGLIAKRRDVLQQTDELSGATVLPEGYSAEERSRIENELATVRRRCEHLQSRLEGDDSLRRQLECISIPEGLLDFEEAINELKDRRAVTVRAQSDTVKLRRKIETLESQAIELLGDLGLGSDLDDVERYRLKSDDQVVIRNLASDAKRVREQPRLLAQQREDIEAELAKLRSQLESLGESLDVGALESVLKNGPGADELQHQGEALQREIDVVQRTVDDQFSTLGLWTGSLKQLRKLVAPLEETVQRFREDFAQQESAVDLLRHEADKLTDEQAQVRQEIAALRTAGSVPTENELNKLRNDRDELWQSVRDDWLREMFTKSMPIEKAEKLASRFAKSVSESDQLADRLRRETERVAQLAGHTARQTRIEEQITRVEVASKTAAKETADLHKEWKKFWKSVGVSEPLSPTEMVGWLRRFNELRATLAEFEALSEQLARLKSQEEQAADVLRTELKRIGEKALTRDSLAVLSERAGEIVRSAREQAVEFERLTRETRQLTARLEVVARDEKRAADELVDWQSQWAPRMQQLGCEVDAIAEQANERMSMLNRVFELLRQTREEQQRIAEIEADARQFDRDTQQLADRFLGSDDCDSAVASIELFNVLQKAKADQDRLEMIQEDEHNTTVELLEQQKVEEGLVQELDSLCRLAGVADAAFLPEKERTSTNLADLQRRRRDIEDQLHEQTAGQSLDDFVADAESVDADELPDQIERIERELDGLRMERDDAVGVVRELENLADEADGNDKAANLEQESLGVLGRMHDEAERYMQLRLASYMLRRQIEVHRAENEDPLLRRASTLFATVTCGAYSGLRIDYETDNAVIVGVRPDQRMVHVPGMSDGTRNQLYLALRLAYVESQLEKFEPMPFIVDDILVHFDDQRSAATLKTLAELSTRTQVIFLTHHAHLLDLAAAHLSPREFVTHRIDSKNIAREQPVQSEQSQ